MQGRSVLEGQGSFYTGRRVWVAGHSEAIGSAIVRRLWREPCEIILTSRGQLDLLRQADVERWMQRHRPQVVFLAADRRGARSRKAEVRARALQETLAVNINVLEAAFQSGAEVLVNLTGVRSRSLDPFPEAMGGGEGTLIAWPTETIAQQAAQRLTLGYVRRSAARYVAPMPLYVFCPHDSDPLSAAALWPLVEQIASAAANDEPSITLEVSALAGRGVIHIDDLADGAVFAAAFATDGVVHFAPSFRVCEFLQGIANTVGYRGELEIIGASHLPLGQDASRPGFLAGALGWRPRLAAAEMAQQIHASWMKRGEARRRARPN